jgi:hypothetical protein
LGCDSTAASVRDTHRMMCEKSTSDQAEALRGSFEATRRRDLKAAHAVAE